MLLNQVQSQNNALTQQRNAVEQFLSTYQQQQDSIRKNIAALESQIEATR
jgi:cell division septum initiation protein DivIVA